MPRPKPRYIGLRFRLRIEANIFGLQPRPECQGRGQVAKVKAIEVEANILASMPRPRPNVYLHY